MPQELLRGFIDASTTFAGRPTMTVAAWAGRPASWEMFDKFWPICRDHAGIAKFHMTDYAARRGEYACWPETKRRAVVHDLLALIRSVAVYGVSISVDVDQFKKQWDDLPPFIFCASMCISVMAMRLTEHGVSDQVSYIYDNGDRYGGLFRTAMNDVLGLGERYREMLTARDIEPGSGRTWPGLDAVDYLAWAGAHYPGHHYDRVAALNVAEFWRLRDEDLTTAISVVRSQPTGNFPELKRLAPKWGFRAEDV